MMFQWVYWNVSITHFAPLLSVTASRKFKTHQVELSCLIYVLSTFCKWISGKMPPFFVILQGALRNTLIFFVEFNFLTLRNFCWIQMHSLVTRPNVHFHLLLEQGRKRRDDLQSSLEWQMWLTVTQGYWHLNNADVLRRWLLLNQNWMAMFPSTADSAKMQREWKLVGLLSSTGALHC